MELKSELRVKESLQAREVYGVERGSQVDSASCLEVGEKAGAEEVGVEQSDLHGVEGVETKEEARIGEQQGGLEGTREASPCTGSPNEGVPVVVEEGESAGLVPG